MTFQQAIQKWLDYKWPKKFIATNNGIAGNDTGAGGEWVQIHERPMGHLMCVSTGGHTCLIDHRKDKEIRIVPLADPKYFRQLQALLRTRR